MEKHRDLKAAFLSTAPTSVGFCVVTFCFSWLAYAVMKDTLVFSLSDVWVHWDAVHYLDLARNGYETVPDKQNHIAFLPLYPILTHLLSRFIRDIEISSLLISNFAFIVSAALLYLLVKKDQGEKKAYWAMVLLASFPTAYFLHASYPESLFLALTLASFLAARSGKWYWCGIFGYFATFTRINGVALVPALMIEYLAQKDFKLKKVDRQILGPILAGFGFLTYLAINYHLYGDFLKFIEFQGRGWGRHSAPPWTGLLAAWSGLAWRSPYEKIMVSGMEIVAGFTALVGALLGLRYLRLSYAVYFLIGTLLVICNSFWVSQPRQLLCLFPLFILMTQMIKKEASFILIALSFFFFQALFLICYITGRWAF